MILRCLTDYMSFFFITVIVAFFSGCTTQKTVSSDLTNRFVTDMMQRMDSLIQVHSVVRQDSTWQQEILRQFESIRERSDTSHYVVVDSFGNIIKERIVINNVREVISETEREQLTVMLRRLEVMDSTMQMMRQQLSHADSLLQQKENTIEKQVQKPLSWWKQFQLLLGRLVLIAIAILFALWLLRKKLPWLPFGK